MLYPVLAVIAGIVILVVGADRFVGGAASLAKHFGVPPLLIGIVIVGFGTSTPEMIVSASAALRGTAGIALGNAYGSNITNIALILGASAMINPIRVTAAAIRRELPILLAVTTLAVLLLWDGGVSRTDAVIMIAAFAVSLSISIHQSLRERRSAADVALTIETATADTPPAPAAKPWASCLWVLFGLGLMMASSEMLVWGSVSLARHFGVSDLIIGLTVVAVGTSLPEFASSIMAARKGEDDLALGNIIGSNVFNSLLVVGIAGLIHPMAAEPDLLRRDMPVMAGFTVLLFIFCLGKKGRGRISRLEGSALFALYLTYTAYLIYTASR